MSQSMSVSPAAVGVSCAVAGAGLGYVAAPEKYSLKQLLTQEADTFEKTIPKAILDKASDKQKTAYNSLVEARKSVAEALKNKKADEKITELVKNEDLKNAFKGMKKMLPKAKVQSMVIGAAVAGVMGTLLKIIFGRSSSPAVS
ncbi:MAG: hypothetical protein ACLSWI_06430 [Candidatus Gastranaerophilaceae bacterium]